MPLSPRDAAALARMLVQAEGIAPLAARFLKAACTMSGIRYGVCYWREAADDGMRPIASQATALEQLPLLSLQELDNPLVYCLRSGKARHISQLDTLIGVGRGYEELGERLAGSDAWQVLPLFDAQRKPAAVVLLAGTGEALQAWLDDPAWQELWKLYDAVLSGLLNRSGADELALTQQAVLQQQDEERGRRRLLSAGFIGAGAAARRVREEMLRQAGSSLSLLVTGETGAGKDHAAWLIHQASSRKGKFVPVNCAAIPRELIEAELFGATRGAYTGATQARTGLVAEADKGTLFLDEIGDMPLPLQGTLLRLLNEKKFRPVGATREQSSDFRLICATHRPLPERVRDGLFREDLYFRIRQLVLHIPPLRERIEDVPALVSHILLEHNREQPGRVAGISDNALASLQRYGFPGNVRELRSLVLAAAERTPRGKRIQTNQLVELESNGQRPAAERDAQAVLQHLWQTDNLPAALATFERLLLDDRLRQAAGSRRLAAISLGIPKRTLARKCLDLNLNGEESR
ncbi:sigma 54-interacting transcriptional regulator [Pseudomonas sp. TH05]|uniref:sigma 54-interacting transcriptional regulator n=1 Tax=unclassified Pseudomonas TaxID=196821 RepID=UPI001912D2BB|nr:MULTISPECIES: sigma 54-interacting transcriptional regulator [unclassified Pseudomonas]MBK5541767.1 sigma 54-interacting transcriptional regulator [Pseudomonas sp. TH07]MBK5555036.1 sigma 54-interacting transcriptional regulator [Pseudomonas sp. TH05]